MSSHQNDTTEFITLLTSHQTALKGLLISMLPGCQDINDILQETNIVLWEKMSSYKAGTDFKAWSYAVARIKVMQYWDQRKKQGKMVLSNELVNAVAEARQADTPKHICHKLQALNLCLKQLNSTEAEMVSARYTGKKGLQTFAEQSGRPVGSLRVSLYRIRTKLKNCIEIRLRQEGGLA